MHPARVIALLRNARRFIEGTDRDAGGRRDDSRFTVLRRGERNIVLRAALPNDDGAAAPDVSSVVLKLAGADGELAETDRRYMLALTGTGVTPDVVAELGDVRGFAMLDAGDETLAWRLERGSAADVRQGMVSCAQAYAQLHVAGRSLLERNEEMRDAAMTRELGRWLDGLPRALAWLHLPDGDAGVRRAISRISASWIASGESVTLTHGDPAPSNVLFLADGAARLVDFEYAAPRHPAYDVTAWDVLCPLPNDMVQVFRDEYARERAALGWSLDDEVDAYPAIIGHRALALLGWLPVAARARDCAWVEEWSARQAVLHTLDQLARFCRADGELHALSDAAESAARSWRREWVEVGSVVPPWPAFRDAVD